MRLQVRKAHLHFLAFITRFVEFRSAIKCTRLIASIFVDVARDLALWSIRAALRLERTCPTVIGAREVAELLSERTRPVVLSSLPADEKLPAAANEHHAQLRRLGALLLLALLRERNDDTSAT